MHKAIGVVFLLAGCATQPDAPNNVADGRTAQATSTDAEQSEPATTVNETTESIVELPAKLVVSDGAGNSWTLDRVPEGYSWRYEPMTRERSSSGFYSGGEPASGRLQAEPSQWFAQEVDRLLGDESVQVDARMMGTVMVERESKGQSLESAIVKGEAGEELVARLKSLLPK